jgi:capsular polysaccharide biosynthesis protein
MLRIFTVLALGAIAAAAAVAVTLTQPVQYRSTLVLVAAGTGERAYNEAVVRSLESLIVSPPVATDVAKRAGVDLTAQQVTDRITVTRPPASTMLEISVLDTDEARSVALARETAPALKARLSDTEGDLPGYDVVAVNTNPVTAVIEPPRERNALIGLGAGLLVGAALVAWRPRRTRPIKSEAEAGRAFDTPLYATLPLLGSGSWRSHSLDISEEQLPIGWPPAARRLVVLASGGRPSVRLVQLLATAIAQSGRDVLLVDAEPEERGLTAIFGQHGRPGFFEGLSGGTDITASTVVLDDDMLPREMVDLVPPDGGRISLIPAGDVEISPAALGGVRVTHALRRVLGDATVIVHAPRLPGPYPVNQIVEFADAVVVPALEGRTRVEDAQSVTRLVTSITGAPMYVVLLTDRPTRRRPARDDYGVQPSGGAETRSPADDDFTTPPVATASTT